MSQLRDVRRAAAARTLGERHPWAVLYGARAVVLVFVLAVLAAATWLVLRAGHAVSGWWHRSGGPVSRPVSQAVPASGGVVSWVPWWGWGIAAAILVVLVLWGLPRLRYKMKYGIWPL
jgi:hypothetical protein